MKLTQKSRRQGWRKSLRNLGLAAAVMFSAVLPVGLVPQAYAAVADHVVISEIYGAGGNAGAVYQHDYVELYNPGSEAASVDGWSVQYAAADRENWLVTRLSGSIPAHGYYLVRLASGGTIGAGLPAADATGGTNISATRGKLALVKHATALSGNPVTDQNVVDFVGYGSANAYEGAGPASAPSAAKSIVRKSDADSVVPGRGSAWDSDSNESDFLAMDPQPQNSMSPAEPPGEDDGQPPGGEWPDARPISEVRNMAGGTKATIEGIVIAAFEAGGKTNVYLQDETAGMLVRAAGLGSIVQIGDKIKATGSVNDYYGLPQLEPAKAGDVAITEKQAGAPVPQPVTSADFSLARGEAFEAELVTIENVTALTRDSRGNVTLQDQYGSFLAKPFDAALLKPGATYERLTGVVTYDFNEYKLVPRFAQDVIGEGGSQPDKLHIRDIQGKGHRSPYENAMVSMVEGIVTAVVPSGTGTAGFYMQDPTPDDDPLTSEGIYVYEPNAPVRAGDHVEVSGVVKEYVTKSREATDLTLTEIDAAGVVVKARNLPLPEPVTLGEGDYVYPAKVIDNDSFALFDPSEDGIDFWESLEGMLVQVNQPRVVGGTRTFANPPSVEFVIISDEADPDKARTPLGGVAIAEDNYNPERIIVGDRLVAGAPEVKVGDRFDGPIVGVIDYSFTNFKLYNTAPLPDVVDSGFEREVTEIAGDEDHLTVATYNIENFSARAAAEKVSGLAASIVHHMQQPDIVAVVEMQDNNGPQDNGVTDANQSAQVLIDAIISEGGERYRYVDIAPENKRDGGQPGGNIRVGFLYNPARVSLADRPAGDAVTPVRVVSTDGKAQLSLNPGRIDPLHPAFTDSRKPLAAEFLFGDESVIVIAGHFNSKGGDDGLYGKQQPPVLASEPQRVEIARVVNDFVQEITETQPDANVIVLGDLNDFQFSRPLRILAGEELTNLVETLSPGEQYTYNYQGNAQALDHILVSNHLADRSELDIVHINADFTEADGRVSDHDPLVAKIKLSAGTEPWPGEITPEKQREQNRKAAEKIRAATDEATVLHQFDAILTSLKTLIESDQVSAWDKWSVIADTIETVLAAAAEQAEDGIVTEAALAALATDFLKEAISEAIRAAGLAGEDVSGQALSALEAFLQTAVLPLDEDERPAELLEELQAAAEKLLDMGGALSVPRGAIIDEGDSHAELVLSVLEALTEAFEDGPVEYEPLFSIRVKASGDHTAESAAVLSEEVTSRLAEIEAAVRLEEAAGAWVLLPAEALGSFVEEALGITLEPADDPAVSGELEPFSSVYDWKLLAEGELVKKIEGAEAQLGIPVSDADSRNLTVFWHDGKKWRTLEDEAGDPIKVDVAQGIARFAAAQTGPIVLGQEKKQEEQPPVRALIIKDRHFKLKPGEEAQIEVTANLGNGGKHDVTRAEGITYESDHPELFSVSADGVIRVSSKATEKDRAVITITYGGKTAKVQVSVKKK
ncbi:lamin tail domain-containing protein [Brevibacillus composti]|uniref:Lamin tail domain-containing protein n=1 Tax=Brevibacillus composti TaxID=2796470 RepID=A0A7T5JN06_9BACL|nr:endonuclease/exonuclease/phosphatase family protein [Brevibacillus composti]QQE73591.1 lamin tail domain-containing protein [Brevibacillus composti]QUO40673.1 lamin tail domain-containing protein [Brevibacillus composti]